MLQIVVDKTVQDKNRDSFVRALKRECEEQKCEYRIVESEKGFVINKPYVITEPNNLDLVGIARAKWDCDNYATARSIVELLPNDPINILLIGRGKLIGRPLIDLITDTTNHSLDLANSYTSNYRLSEKINSANIIINSATSKIEYYGIVQNKTLIDVNNNFKTLGELSDYYNMRAIGKLTVQKIVADAKKKVFKDAC